VPLAWQIPASEVKKLLVQQIFWPHVLYVTIRTGKN
jgi:hypothetical protein